MADSGLIDDRNCFGCGSQNVQGLGLTFEYGEGAVRCSYVADARFGGWAGMLHGGIVATMLDEAMAHAAISSGVHAVTGRLEVRFRKPAPTGALLILEGSVVRRHGRALDIAATLRSEGGALYALGNGRFIAEPPTDKGAHPSRG